MYRNHISYQGTIHKNANQIIKIKVDKIASTIAFNAFKNPVYYYNDKESEKDSVIDKKEQNKGFNIPANIFLFTVKDKEETTLFSVLKINNKDNFKNYLINQFKIKNFSEKQNFTKATIKDQKINLAFNEDKCVIAFNPSKEKVEDIFTDLLVKNNTLISDDTFWQTIKNQNNHISYISTNLNQLGINFIDGEIDINGHFKQASHLVIPANKSNYKFSDSSSVSMFLNLKSIKDYKSINIKNQVIDLDSLNTYYNGNFYAEISGKTSQTDSIITYTYNDDFEKVETLTAVKKEVPEININLNANSKEFVGYLKRISAIKNNKVNKDLFPLYQFQIYTLSQQILLSTNLQNSISKTHINNSNIFGLVVNFDKLKKQDLFPVINPYIKQLEVLKVTGRKDKDSIIKVEGRLLVKNKNINALVQFFR